MLYYSSEVSLHQSSIFEQFTKLVAVVFGIKSVSVLGIDAGGIRRLFNEFIANIVV